MPTTLTNKERSFLFISISYIFYVLFPLFGDLTHLPEEVPSLLVCITLLCMYPQAFMNRTTCWFAVYALVLATYLSLQKPLTIGIGTVADPRKMLIEYAFILPSLSIFNVLFYLNDVRLFRIIAKSAIIIMATSFLLILPVLISVQSVLRTGDKELTEGILGLPNYTLMHAYVMMVVPAFYAVSVTVKKEKVLLALFALLLCYVVYSTYVTTSLVVLVGIVIAILVYRPSRPVESFLLAIIAIVCVWLLYKSGLLLAFLNWIAPVFEGTAVEPKIVDFQNSLIAGELTGGTIEVRNNLHHISFNSFLENPFFGRPRVGGHSNFLDRLGGLGIVGFLPFFMIFFSAFLREFKELESSKARVYFLIGVAAIATFLFMKGLFGLEGWMMSLVLLPSCMIYYDYHGSSMETESDEDDESNPESDC